MANNLDHVEALKKIIQGLNEQDNDKARDSIQLDDEQNNVGTGDEQC